MSITPTLPKTTTIQKPEHKYEIAHFLYGNPLLSAHNSMNEFIGVTAATQFFSSILPTFPIKKTKTIII